MRICFFFLFVLCWNNSWAIDIEIYTENWPPLNFENGGKITGFTTDIVREIQRRTKIKGEIKLLPWKRAYFNALNKKNALIYSIVRNPQREGLFRWVGRSRLHRSVRRPYGLVSLALRVHRAAP